MMNEFQSFEVLHYYQELHAKDSAKPLDEANECQ
jgi:hypothetical protein